MVFRFFYHTCYNILGTATWPEVQSYALDKVGTESSDAEDGGKKITKFTARWTFVE